ncbi:vWA domain-containing protein [Metallumcola ferriviriculae]
MFTRFFFDLRREGIPVTLTEWYTLMEALALGLAGSSLTNFYSLARSILVKNEAYFDKYDQVFISYFEGIESMEEIAEEVLKWLDNPFPPLELTEEEKDTLARQLKSYDLEELKRQFQERMKEQEEEHHGGNHWVGTGGTSPFGHSGYHPAGVRVGGQARNRSAVKIAAERRFREYRTDVALGVRQFQAALKELRLLSSRNQGPKDQLNLEETIEATADNAGYLRLIFERERKNKIKVLLLMDVGGSMYYHAQVCNQLFTAVNRMTHFSDLQVYYFHNTIYQNVYRTPACSDEESVSTAYLLKTFLSEYRLFIVGDACMAPSELSMPGGVIWWGEYNKEASIIWLQRLKKHFTYSVWLNPVASKAWDTVHGSYTLNMVRSIFPMFELTVQGLSQASKALMQVKAPTARKPGVV